MGQPLWGRVLSFLSQWSVGAAAGGWAGVGNRGGDWIWNRGCAGAGMGGGRLRRRQSRTHRVNKPFPCTGEKEIGGLAVGQKR